MVNYDIACRVLPYFRRFETELEVDIARFNPGFDPSKGATAVAGIKFAIGRWHAYGHQSSCHSKWSMLFQEGIGLSYGEDMERLWHVLNMYGGSTSQMSLGNRNDSLSLVLYYLRDVKVRGQADKLMTVSVSS